MTKEEKVEKFIQDIKKSRKLAVLWFCVVFLIMVAVVIIYGDTSGRLLPEWVKIVEAVALFSWLIPVFRTYIIQSTCPICGGNIRKYKNTFHKICPHCHTDIDPDCVFHWLEKGRDENTKRLEIKKEE